MALKDSDYVARLMANTAADEDVFPLVARDKFAAETVRFWCGLAEDDGRVPGDKIADALACAYRMEQFPDKKTPD